MIEEKDKLLMEATNDNIILTEVGRGKTKGGVVLPQNVKYGREGFMVVAVGDGLLTASGDRVPLCVEVGDYVVICVQATEYEWEGTKYFMTCNSNIRSRVRKANIKATPILQGIES